jgi:beta-lactamase regulating signal transducer with metallopeptidase domain
MMLAYSVIADIGRMVPSVTTIVLVGGVLAIGAARVFASRSAAARSLIWQAALLASVVVPIATVVGPALRLPTREASMPALRIAQRVLAPPSAQPPRGGIDLSTGLGLLWLCGFIPFSVRFAAQLVAAERLRRRAVEAEVSAVSARARRDAAYSRDVSILVSLDVDVPLALGALRPAIIVPASSSEWNEDEWYVVLLHELAHLRRRDLLARAIGMAAGLLHWFNPLVPWMRTRLERDAELAADALVLHSGVLPSRYADVLLAMAERASWRVAPEPSLTFARVAGLERRIGEILCAGPGRPLAHRYTGLSVTMTSALLAAILGCVQLSVQSSIIRSPLLIDSPLAADASDWRVAARSALAELLHDPSPQVRAAAAHSLEQFARNP